MLDRLKTALRISHNKLDSEILLTIEAARSELSRVGCSSSMAASDDALVQEAIITYCLMKYGNIKDYEKYFNAWQYQIDNLRKTTRYTEQVRL